MLRPARSTQLPTTILLVGLLSLASGAALAAERAVDAGPEISNQDLFEKSLYAATQALAFYGAWDAPEERRRVAEIGYAIAQQTEFRDFPFSFYLIDMPEPNAFALPGGQIFMTRGMLALGLDDDMLAGLLGHEIGHVVLEHGVRMERRAKLLSALSQALLVGVMISADNNRGERVPTSVYDPTRGSREDDGDLIQGTAAAGLVLSELLLRNYSREFEDEADEEGLRLAAAAGYSPDGTERLMAKMQARIPESRDYGYWRTHPFFRDRVRAARARNVGIKPQPRSDATDFRQQTQDVLLDFADRAKKLEPEAIPMLEQAALTAWPQGDKAEWIRLSSLHELRDAENRKVPLSRDYGTLLAAYRHQHELVRELTPESEFLASLDAEIADLEAARSGGYEKARQVFDGGVYETDFLRTFLSNYPDTPERGRAALALGDAYSRLGRPGDAVTYYLEAQTADPTGDAGTRATRGLRVLTPRIEQLTALQALADASADEETRRLAAARLDEQVDRYEELANGADYLREHPDGEYVDRVTTRLHSIAEKLHGELLLYQQVGDHVKALARIQAILTDAPTSPAAERIRDQAVFES